MYVNKPLEDVIHFSPLADDSNAAKERCPHGGWSAWSLGKALLYAFLTSVGILQGRAKSQPPVKLGVCNDNVLL